MPKDKKQRRRYPEHLFIIAIFCAFGFLFSLPTFMKPCSTIPTATDSWQNVWNFWHVHRALFQTDASLFHTRLLFFPSGIGLQLTNLTYLFTVPMSLMLLVTNPEFALNLSLFIAVVLSGYCAYLLCRSLGLSFISSFFAGFVFAFCPLRMLYTLVGQLDTSAAFCLPLCAWLYWRFRKQQNLSSAIYLGLGYAASALISWYFAVMVAVVLIVLILADAGMVLLRREKLLWVRKPKCWLLLALSAFIPALILSPLIGMVLKAASTDAMLSKDTIGIGGSADILAFLLPDPNPMWRATLARQTGFHLFLPISIAEKAYQTFNATALSKPAFVGYTVLALAYGVIFIPRKKKLIPWIAVAIVGAALALGPRIQMGGRIGAPMPMALLYGISFLRMFRAPQRFTLIYLLAMSVLSGIMIEHLLQRLPKVQTLIISGIFILLLLEFLMIPNLLIEPIPQKSPVLSRLAKEENIAIVNVPVACTPESAWHASRYLYLQTYHEQPMLFGYTSRAQGRDIYGISERFWVLKEISVESVFGVSLEPEARNESASKFNIDPEDIQQLPSALEQLRIDRIMVHKDLLSKESSRNMLDALSVVLGEPVLEDETLVLFEVQ